jgi:hypothetical protein
MRGVTWKFKSAVNMWEGTVKGDEEATLFVQGRGAVTDVRESRKAKDFRHPNHYKISSVDEGKRLAEDLVNGDNVEKHEANRLAWIADGERVAKLIQDADELIKKLKLQNAFKEANK